MNRSTLTAVLLACGSLLILPGTSFGQVTTSVTRTVGFDYDAYGNLSRQTVEPDDATGQYKVVTDFGTDAYGSVLTRTLSWTDPTLGAQSRIVETNVYDSRSRFATSVTNAKSQTETRAYSDAYGSLTSLVGPNALTTTWQYDGWGGRIREDRADGTATTWAYRKCIDTCTGGAAAVTVTQNFSGTSQTTVPSEAFSDVLGRSIRNRTWGFDGTAILTERVYDNSGRLYQTSRPRFAASTPVWSTRSYDAIGRATQEQTPSATGSGTDTTLTAYNGLASTTTNALNQTRTQTRNGLGSLKSVTDAYGKTTSYLYDPFGNLTRTTDPLLNQISVAYDRLGRKTQLVDPNLGTWNYLVNALGQTWQQTDAKGQVTTFTFDALARMTRRLEMDLDSRWDYDSATTGIGKLAETYTWVAGAKDFRRIYAYDSLSRVSSVTASLDWDYATESAYDGFGRLFRHNYRRNAKGGSGGPYTAAYSVYNANGYASQIVRGSSSGADAVVQQTLSIDAEGRVTQEQYGAGGALLTSRQFNVYTGRLEAIASGSGGATTNLQNDHYTYDSLGNVTFRSQLANGSGALMSESFTYDSLNRLTSSAVVGQSAKTIGYDAVGNVTTKGNVGSYTYFPSGGGSSHPNAVASIVGSVAGVGNPTFGYDANGNTLGGLGTTDAWTSFNQPSSIDKLSGSSAVRRTAWLYDTDHQRTRQTIAPMSGGVPGAIANTIYYAGAIEKEVDVASNLTTIRTYLPEGIGYLEERISGTTVASTATATIDPRYFLTDPLGSVLATLDDAAAVLQLMSYDPWGRRRNTDGTDDAWSTRGAIANAQDHTGFTGEEQLDNLGMVNLNGRMYDPIVARMLSADPRSPDLYNPRDFNRYSYVFNNPLAYVDPTGFDAWERVDFRQEGGFFGRFTAWEQQTGDRIEITGSRNNNCWLSCDGFQSEWLKAKILDSFNRAFSKQNLQRVKQASTTLAIRLVPVARTAAIRGGVTVMTGGGPENPVADVAAAIVFIGSVAYDVYIISNSNSDDTAGANTKGTDRPPSNPNAPPPDNAYDPSGPKAPGRPTAADGFEPPKGGDQWVKNPNGRGYGWLGSDGRVWVPTGPEDQSKGESHGGPHWDVQTGGRRPSYENIKPVRP